MDAISHRNAAPGKNTGESPRESAMKEDSSTISRRRMLASMGGAMLGSAFAPAMLGEAVSAPQPMPRNAEPGKPGARPNILWITTEGVPTTALSCYGSRLIETPNIDRIAQEGMRFENSFTTNALCAPSRATLLTGRTPMQLKESDAIPADEPTVEKVFAAAG
jgi:hypothetical protein